MASENGWQEWSKHVLKTLEDLNDKYESLDEKVNQIRIDIAKLQVKAGIWGAMGGAVPVVIGLAIWILRSFK